jgi:hypothetical protein
MQLYVAGLGGLVGVVYLFSLACLLVGPRAGMSHRLVLIALAAVIGLTVLYWDVAITSWRMHELCPTAGLALKRTVRADGYLTTIGGPEDIKLGFKYVEVRMGKLFWIYEKVGNEVRQTTVDTNRTPYVPRSRYEYISGDDVPWVGLANISTKRSELRDRLTGEVIGTTTIYKAYPGWVDRHTTGLIGNVVWSCPVDPLQDILKLQMAVLPNP